MRAGIIAVIALASAAAACRRPTLHDVPDDRDASPPPSPRDGDESEDLSHLVRAAAQGDRAFVDTAPGVPWSPDCMSHRPCPAPVAPLPTCETGDDSSPWPLPGFAHDEWEGHRVRIRGRLAVEPSAMTTQVGCLGPDPRLRRCCNHATREVILAGRTGGVVLEDRHCGGDESRTCCRAPAFGQRVVATGYLTKNDDRAFPWSLRQVSLCAIDER